MRISDWSSDVCSSDLRVGNSRRCSPCAGNPERPEGCFHRRGSEATFILNRGLNVGLADRSSGCERLIRTAVARMVDGILKCFPESGNNRVDIYFFADDLQGIFTKVLNTGGILQKEGDLARQAGRISAFKIFPIHILTNQTLLSPIGFRANNWLSETHGIVYR